jgi:(E)-2-((N-methylformamido)methylene)succinate hydrolase
VPKFKAHDGLSIAYAMEGSGPAVVLIHGVGADKESWDEIVPRLARRFTVARLDLRGHGASSRMAECAMSDFVADVDGLADAVGFAAFHLVGFSLGGLIAQHYALSNPGRVNRLALISTVAQRTEQERARMIERTGVLARDGIAAVTSAAQDRWFTPAFLAAHPDRVNRRLQQLQANDHKSYTAAYRVFAEADAGIDIGAIRAPTLVVTGEHDQGSSPRMARLLHQSIRGSRLEILPELRHSVLMEAPDLIAGLLDDFLAA